MYFIGRVAVWNMKIIIIIIIIVWPSIFFIKTNIFYMMYAMIQLTSYPAYIMTWPNSLTQLHVSAYVSYCLGLVWACLHPV